MEMVEGPVLEVGNQRFAGLDFILFYFILLYFTLFYFILLYFTLLTL
jgi:hypothetical protein